MTRYLKPVHHLQQLPKGRSKPQLIRFNNGNEYVVKFINNRSGTRVLVNEYVAGKLAQLLSLPVVPFRLVYIAKKFINENPTLIEHNFQSGYQLASLYIKDSSVLKEFLPLDQIYEIKISNRDKLAGVIVFDYWIGNYDRNRSNVLLKLLPNGEYQCYMIDHGHVFGKSSWTIETLKETIPDMATSWRKVHSRFFSMLQGEEEIAAYIDKIMKVSDQTIHQIVRSIPRDWDVSDQEKEALAEYLIQSRRRLPDLRLPPDEILPK